MNPDKPQAARELWIQEEPQSNRALTRSDAEKWPDDIDGKPNPKIWLHVIEHSAYERLKAELEQLKKLHELERNLSKDLEVDRAHWKVTAEKLQEEITRLKVELDAVRADGNYWNDRCMRLEADILNPRSKK